MFEGFAGEWTPLLPSGALTQKPRQVRVAGTDLVAWRGNDGEVGVLLDRCPHRSVSLSAGSRTEDGCVACPFHGWEFAPSGECTHVPFNPDAPRHRLGATAVPHVERGGFVWVFTGLPGRPVLRADGAEALSGQEVEARIEAGPHYSALLDDASLTRMDHAEVWRCHWTRAMENMLDFPHLPYVHRTTIGRFVRAKMTRHSRLTHTFTREDERGFHFQSAVDQHEPASGLHWFRPHGMALDTIPEPKVMRIHVWCVPADHLRTRMMMTVVRNFAGNPAASLPMDRFNVHILRQDRAVVESSNPAVVPDGGGVEYSVPTDQPTLKFRTFYHRQLRDTRVAAS